MTTSTNRPCRAADKMTCRVHGAHFIAQEVYAPMKKRGFRISIEEIEIFTEDIIEVIHSAEDENSYVESDRDEDGIYKEWKSRNPVDARKFNGDIRTMIHEITWRHDADKKKLPENNVLDPDLKSQYGGYAVALGSLIAREGEPVKANASYYSGWSDHVMAEHTNRCGIVAVSNPREESWGEFNGTFNDEDDSVHGAEAEAQCACGNFKGTLRIKGSLTELTRKLFDQ